jgi:hypothetical protein
MKNDMDLSENDLRAQIDEEVNVVREKLLKKDNEIKDYRREHGKLESFLEK